MNKWIMLLCAGLLVVMIGCGPKDQAAEPGTGDEVAKPEGDTNKPEGDVSATEEKKPEEAPVTTPEDKKPEEPTSAEGAPKPEEMKGDPKSTEPAPEKK